MKYKIAGTVVRTHYNNLGAMFYNGKYLGNVECYYL